MMGRTEQNQNQNKNPDAWMNSEDLKDDSGREDQVIKEDRKVSYWRVSYYFL